MHSLDMIRHLNSEVTSRRRAHTTEAIKQHRSHDMQSNKEHAIKHLSDAANALSNGPGYGTPERAAGRVIDALINTLTWGGMDALLFAKVAHEYVDAVATREATPTTNGDWAPVSYDGLTSYDV